MKKIVVLVFAALVFSGFACASLIPTLDSGSPTGTGPYTWTYTLKVSSDEQLNPDLTVGQKGTCAGVSCPSGTYFTIYDIFGLTSASQTAANWTNTIQFTGITPSTQIIATGDSNVLLNVTWFYTGPAQPAVQSTTGQDLIIPGFSLVSTSNNKVTSTSAYNGTKFGIVGLDQGQNPVMVPGANVPEPASMLLIGGGLVGLALLRRKLVR